MNEREQPADALDRHHDITPVEPEVIPGPAQDDTDTTPNEVAGAIEPAKDAEPAESAAPTELPELDSAEDASPPVDVTEPVAEVGPSAPTEPTAGNAEGGASRTTSRPGIRSPSLPKAARPNNLPARSPRPCLLKAALERINRGPRWSRRPGA